MTRATMHSLKASMATVALLAAMSGPALAVDGVVLIDQNKALAGNVTPGDTPGFPVTITLPGSYRLASNLIVPNADTSAILIATNTPGVNIDLNGFSIIGPTVCTGFPLVCSPVGSGMGVANGPGPSDTSRGTAVRNGAIMGMGSTGIFLLGSGAAVENVTLINNGGDGILLNLGTVTGNRIVKNGANGISGSSSVITHNMVTGNRSIGITVNDSLVTNNVMVVNGSVGLSASNTGFGANVFSSNNGSFANPQFTGRISIAPNSCDGSVCP